MLTNTVPNCCVESRLMTTADITVAADTTAGKHKSRSPRLTRARWLLALSLLAGLAGPLLIDGLAAPALANNGKAVGNPRNGNNGKAVGNPRNGNNGKGPNPSRGNAGRNSGSSSVSSSVLAPRIRFAPATPGPN